MAQITALKIASISSKVGMHRADDNLWLSVKSENAASWVFKFSAPHPYTGRDGKERRAGTQREMGLGPYPTISLARAREMAAQARELRALGNDPIKARNAVRASESAAKANAVTFRSCAQSYIEAQRAGWRSAKHAAQWEATLAAYAYPHFGELAISAVDRALVIKALEPIWNAKPETANRVRGRIEAILDWATARALRLGDNPARWQGHLQHVFPRRSKIVQVRHRPALPFDQIPNFMAELRAKDSLSARALEFAILTAARTGAVIGARLGEIDLHSRVWTVPADRAGTKIMGEDVTARRVPLSGRCIEILGGLPYEQNNLHVFIGSRYGKGLSNMAMLELMRTCVLGTCPMAFEARSRIGARRKRIFRTWCRKLRFGMPFPIRSRRLTGAAISSKNDASLWKLGPLTVRAGCALAMSFPCEAKQPKSPTHSIAVA